ncbi:MAG: serine O-acetyltransferase [Spirochaetales bacterium]|nr:serine O-acetyltransferase [Spirochaetales bacterium]
MKFDYSPFLVDYVSSFDRTKGSFEEKNLLLPNIEDIRKMMNEFLSLLFPGGEEFSSPGMLRGVISRHMEAASDLLYQCSKVAWRTEVERKEASERSRAATTALLKALPELRAKLKKDAMAGFMGDPAAKSVSDIILSYPGFKAVAIHRIGHFLLQQGVPYIPRMLNEIVHSDTGIDIHPGAEIGDSFFIDHGTGVVIGETTVIKDNVKIYQGVTLGALSFPKDACGMLLRDIKRHPTIENNVTIYANASVLGPITVGEGSIIGSNAWVKEDIPPYSRVLPSSIETKIIQRKLPKEK